ncbi:hypothetical protein RCO27_17260 [Sphingosinicella sp. LHD-64]|uniref:hypothetical protein n=1 Tax=Sphingosinicella sp. LHD-64 TaxID=3072139 RepID=UPI00280C842B|nr:hypothetical protein [Sphingosinicella sp. LHD-64]MDQ8757977.1 hypothetical protein [Sphingosinicella sp. LHD-64]
MSREIVKPYLIQKGEDGRFRLTLRETRFNSQGFPLVTATPIEETFRSATAARTHARKHFGAEAGQFAAK